MAKFIEFEKGVSLKKQLTAARLNAILRAISKAQILDGVGYTVTHSNGGTTINIQSLIGEKGGYIPPLNVIKCGSDSAIGEIFFRITKGFVDYIEPLLDAKIISDKEAKFSLSFGTTTHILISITDIEGTNKSVEIISSPTLLSDTESIGYIRLAQVVISDGGVATINNYMHSSIQTYHCGTTWSYWCS